MLTKIWLSADGFKNVEWRIVEFCSYNFYKFEIENIDEKSDEQYISSLNFNAYADGIAVESKYIVNDIYKDISATLGKGKKTIGYVFYEVPINSTEITIEYSTDFWTDGNNIEFVVQ